MATDKQSTDGTIGIEAVTGGLTEPEGSDLGSNSGSGGNAGTIEPGKRRRRTRAQIEEEEALGILTPQKKPLRAGNQKVISENELALATAGLFNLLASVRGEHWSKSPDECLVFARPCSQWIESVSPAVAKQISSLFLPISTAMGLGCLLVTPLQIEKRILDEQSSAKLSVNGSIHATGQSAGSNRPNRPQTPINVSNGNGIGQEPQSGFIPDTSVDTDTLD